MNTDRIYASLEDKLQKNMGHRVDLQFEDARKVNKTTANFLISYTSETPPSSEEISEFFIRKFNAKVHPFLSTAKIYKSDRVIAVVAQMLNITRDATDIEKRKMKPVIKGSVYLDAPLNEIWELTERNGEKVLVRKVKDDIMALVQARRNSMMDQQSGNKTFAKITEANLLRYLSILEKGDTVRALVEDRIIEGQIVAVSDSEAQIKAANKTHTVPRTAVLEVLAKDQGKEKANKDYVEKYFTDAYGSPEYAKQLTK